jgi:alginate O-acetyltransferase complex protein AlgI
MWVLAFSLFAGAKWIVLAGYFRLKEAPWKRIVAFLFLWPGLNANRFFFGTPIRATAGEWAFALGNTALGAGLLWGAARLIPASNPMMVGWLGMIGVVCLLHFGVFHLVSILWRVAGIDAPPIMKNPIRSTSLGELWGDRWNKAFNELVTTHLFKPVARRHGAAFGTAAVFLVSGALHEIVISLPARGGFGLPTLYFMIQGGGLLAERSAFGRRRGLGRGLRGWLFAALIAAGPVGWLFHPVFVRQVILPMLRAVGAFQQAGY